ncbi:hypothetical protein QNO07_09435 [Streptomyces sp. 549]|uniref:hypothetical protein n=1 Tax=Streptomyces sp. 549 TaxID=3049076 RepID=UPI0024C20DA6|nr:hypothetical protein [Streptomyces sp. 549]MDK1473641.1 hypothetical protein [Streptomyces sp. 549]
MFGRTTAKKLDAAAERLHDAGKRVAGDRGGRVGDAIATATLGPLRDRCNTPCTRTDCTHD